MWDELRQLKASNPNGLWCFLGDFNSIRSQEERIGSSKRIVGTNDISDFNDWISEMELQEIKCIGCRWISHWPDSSQHVLQRDFSDHCPIILKTMMVDWGPKSFRVVDWWLNQKGYQRIVREAWNRDQQGGWGELC